MKNVSVKSNLKIVIIRKPGNMPLDNSMFAPGDVSIIRRKSLKRMKPTADSMPHHFVKLTLVNRVNRQIGPGICPLLRSQH